MNEYRTTTWRANEPLMPDALAYFLTWTTYGTWLPGDERGWISRGKGLQLPNPGVRLAAETRMNESACRLNRSQRELVESTIADHCVLRRWNLHAAKCRTNHVHVVLTAQCKPDEVCKQLKAWCSRHLKAQQGSDCPDAPVRENWWTEKGSHRYIGDEAGLDAAVAYVLYAQDRHVR